MRKLRKVWLILLSVGVIYNYVSGQTRDEGELYNQLTTIKGHVEILNNPEIGRTPGSGIFLVFQRVDCKKCLVGVFADVNGDYRIRVGQGRYKVIVRNPSPPTIDLIAPTQARYVTSTSPIADTVFDINLAIPSTSKTKNER